MVFPGGANPFGEKLSKPTRRNPPQPPRCENLFWQPNPVCEIPPGGRQMRCICSRIASGDFADLKRGDFADDFRACEIPLSIRVRKVVFGFVFGLRNSPSRPANAMYISQIVHWGGFRGRQKMHICTSAEFPLWGISRTPKGEISQTCFGYLKPHAQINTGKGYFGRHSNIGMQIPTKNKKTKRRFDLLIPQPERFRWQNLPRRRRP